MQCGGWGLNGFLKRSSRLVSNGDYAWDSVLTHNARSGQLQLIVRGASVRKDEQILQNGVKTFWSHIVFEKVKLKHIIFCFSDPENVVKLLNTNKTQWI